MSFLLSVLSGAIGANFISGLWGRYALSGIFNIAVGAIAGTGIWTLLQGFSYLTPSLSSLMVVLIAGAASGATLSLALGSLRRVLGEREDHP
ncbi:hypothetical protein [Halovulum sp. GXIMD14793]